MAQTYTFSTKATALQYTTYSGSSWSAPAYQGTYGRSGTPRVGAIIFGNLRAIPWKDMIVSRVTIRMAFGGSGYGDTKTLGLYATSRSSVGGSGAAMLGTNLGQVSTGSAAFNRTIDIQFDESHNAAVFARMANWIENGTTNGIALYLNERVTSSSHNYSRNYASVTAAWITIVYSDRGSGGTVTPNPVELYDDIQLTIDPIVSEYEVTHEVQYTCGTASSQVYSLAGGVTEHTFTIPQTWISEIPAGTLETTAYAVLTTYEAGTLRGTRYLPFTVQVPAAYAPTINTFSVARYTSYIDDYSQTVYIESLTGNHVWVNVDVDMDTFDGDNPGTATLNYWPTDDPENITTETLTWTGDKVLYTDDRSVVPQVVALADSYVFELVVTDGYYTQTAQARIEKAWAPFHVAGSGYGVGIGAYSEGTEQEPEFKIAWPIKAETDAVKSLVDIIYPVGALYITTNNADPATIFPGTTWQQIKDTFLIAAGQTYSAGSTGGAASSTHSHLSSVGQANNNVYLANINGTQSAGQGKNAYALTQAGSGALPSNITMTNTSSATISTIPPYLAVYVWERTA